jgi:hypothetical protein
VYNLGGGGIKVNSRERIVAIVEKKEKQHFASSCVYFHGLEINQNKSRVFENTFIFFLLSLFCRKKMCIYSYSVLLVFEWAMASGWENCFKCYFEFEKFDLWL